MIIPVSKNTPRNWETGTSLLSYPVTGQMYVERCVDVETIANAETVKTPTKRVYRIAFDLAIFDTTVFDC